MLASLRRLGATEVGPLRLHVPARASPWLLAGLVTASTVGYGLTTGQVQNIWILPDELAYGSLARSLATSGHFAIRGVSTLAFPVGYPLLISPAFLAHNPLTAYDTAKWLNALLMSLAAVPVYLLARRLLPIALSLLAAALTLLIPSMAYTGVLMSENALFPLFLLGLLAIVRALERPTAQRQLVALAAVVPAAAVRTEGLLLLPTFLSAIVLLSASGAERRRGRYARSLLRQLWRFKATALVLPLSALLLVAGEAVKGRSPGAVFGRYSTELELQQYPIGQALRWSVYTMVDLELYLAVIPFVPATIAAFALLRRRNVPRPQRAVAAAAVPAVVFCVLAAGATSSGAQGGTRGYPYLPPNLHDRYCFYVVPLYLVLFLYWISRRQEFSNRLLLPLLAGAAALPLVLPYPHVYGNADFDALALLPWHNSLIAGRNAHYAMAAAAALLGAIVIARRSSLAVLQIGIVGALLLFVGFIARHNMAAASRAVATSHPHERSWIDRSVPEGTRVAALWAPDPSWSDRATIVHSQALWRAEFLNTAVKTFFYVGEQMDYDLPMSQARLRNGRLALPAGAADYRYLLVSSPVPALGARIVARDARAGLLLLRLATPAHA